MSASDAGMRAENDDWFTLSEDQHDAFHRDGFLILKGFYDVERDIEPIRRGVHSIIGFVAEQHGVDLGHRPYSSEEFDAGYMQLKAVDRRLASVVYDAVKQLVPFDRLVARRRNEAVFAQLRNAEVIGCAGAGSGIRIDNPDETTYIAPFHQEYPGQFRSLDGTVFWSPLRSMTQAMGPVKIAKGSHKEGLIKVFSEDQSAMGRTGAYALRLVEEDAIIERYPLVEPLAEAGDVLVMDFLTVHGSGRNVSTHPRWSMQLRYFNFAEPTGRRIDWAGSFAAGRSINDVHPGLHVGSEPANA